MKNSAQNKIDFQGFFAPKYTQVPDELFDKLMSHLSGAELKVLLYIMRRTFGFKKDFDNISLRQICNGITTKEGETLDKGTGLSLSTVQVALKGLIEKNCVITGRNRSKEKGDEPTTYSLKMLTLTDYRQGGLPIIGNGGYRKSVTQETVLQNTDIQIRNSSINTRNRSDDNKQHQGDSRTIAEVIKARYQSPKEEQPKLEAPEEIKAVMGEISQEFGDRRHLHANITQVMNIVEKSGRNAETFSTFLYQAKSITKQQGGVKKKMPYFFKVLKETVEV